MEAPMMHPGSQKVLREAPGGYPGMYPGRHLGGTQAGSQGGAQEAPSFSISSGKKSENLNHCPVQIFLSIRKS